MESSIFTDKDKTPDDVSLRKALGELYPVWQEIRTYVSGVYHGAVEEWNFPGPKYGWSFRIRDKKRVIIYLLPRDRFFLVALVFGEKASKYALASGLSPEVKNIIESAKVYAEGRGFRIEVTNASLIDDIKKLIDLKLAY